MLTAERLQRLITECLLLKKAMKTKEIILIIAIVFIGAGCKKKEPEAPAAVRPSPPIVIEFKEPKREPYVYEDSGRRDPFIPLIDAKLGRMAPGERQEDMEVAIRVEGAETETTGLETFNLSGLVWDSKGEVGLLTGENKSFYMVNGKLLNEEGNLLEDIKGERKKDEIVLTKKDKSVSLKIKEEKNKGEGEVK